MILSVAEQAFHGPQGIDVAPQAAAGMRPDSEQPELRLVVA